MTYVFNAKTSGMPSADSSKSSLSASNSSVLSNMNDSRTKENGEILGGAECVNPILYSWINTWYQEANSFGAKSAYSLKRALESVKNHPKVITCSAEAVKLPGIGPTTAQRIEKMIIQHFGRTSHYYPDADVESLERAAKDIPVATSFRPLPPEASAAPSEGKGKATKASRKPTKKKYVPAYRSGGFAILIALLKLEDSLGEQVTGRSSESSPIVNNNNRFYTKSDIMRIAENYSDHSFYLNDTGSMYSTWSSIKTLLEKDLVEKSGNPSKFRFTDEGRKLALDLWKVVQEKGASTKPAALIPAKSNNNIEIDDEGDDDLIVHSQSSIYSKKELPYSSYDLPSSQGDSVSAQLKFDQANIFSQTANDSDDDLIVIDDEAPTTGASSSKSDFKPRVFPAGSFDIVLLLDNRERQKKNDRFAFQEKFEMLGLKFHTRALEVGDFCWIARKKGSTHESDEIVLDYIIERKRLDDLLSSIKEGRFFEQKNRIASLGISNSIFILEHYNIAALEFETYKAHIRTTRVAPQITENFTVHYTSGIDDTVDYLARLTRLINKRYRDKDLYIYPSNLVEKESFEKLQQQAQSANLKCHLDMITLRTIASKSRNVTIREVYLKQLTRMKFISAEKSLAIAQKYPTFRALYEAYQSCTCDEQRRKLLEGVGGIGGKLAQRIASLFCETGAQYIEE